MSRVWDVPVLESTRIKDVQTAAETACRHAGFDAHATAVAALVATELATNLVKHAAAGRIVIGLVGAARVGADAAPGVQISSLDHGPGIGDVPIALQDGYTTSVSSLGAGLGACLRLADEFSLHSRPGQGTVAVARIGPPRPPGAPRERSDAPGGGARAGGINVPLAYAEHSGDAFAWTRSGPRVTLMLADGLGHGAGAAEASTAAVEALRRHADLPPAEILRRLNDALRPTRGAAVSVGQVDEDTGRLSFAGVGNVGARLRADGQWRHLPTHPGIVGAHFPASVPVHQAPWRTDSLLVVHSDGLPGRWTPPEDPEVLACEPPVLAAVVLRNAGSAASPLRDDTSVAVLAPGRGA
jgi:anti-sigma regulatory factor (Ser/Thr protein kinase)